VKFTCDTNVLADVLRDLSAEENYAQPSLVHDALLAASCRESGVTLITRDHDFGRFKSLLRGWRFLAPWPEVSQ
jgi:predicted nucleic acid-binding protein